MSSLKDRDVFVFFVFADIACSGLESLVMADCAVLFAHFVIQMDTLG